MEFINTVVRSLIIAAALHLNITNMKKIRLRVCSTACFTINTCFNVYMLTAKSEQTPNPGL